MNEKSTSPINDLIDIVEDLTDLVEELDPGACNQIGRIRFLIERASRCANEGIVFESRPIIADGESNGA